MADRRRESSLRKASMSPEMQQHLSKRMSVHITFAKDEEEEREQSKAVAVARKAMPYVAICAFFVTFVMFMWVVPCRWGGCPSMCSWERIKSWRTVLKKVELKGSIADVPGLGRKSRNLVFLARCRVLLEDLDDEATGAFCHPTTDGGLIALAGSSGTTAWWRPLHGLPRDVDCSLVDVNGNGVNDCLVVGENGLLDAVDPVSGVVLWYMHSINTLQRPVDLSFPVVLPDLNGDGIEELMLSSRIADESLFLSVVTEHNNLVLVSGKTGRILGRPYKTASCVRISDIQLLSHLNLSYTCQDEVGKEMEKTLNLQTLYTAMTSQAIVNATRLKGLMAVRQHLSPRPALESEYLLNGRQLTLRNYGRCPLCGVSLQVSDQRPGAEDTALWNYTADNSYAMVPLPLEVGNRDPFNGTITSPTVSGFVVKLWQWVNILDEGTQTEPAPVTKTPRDNQRQRSFQSSPPRLTSYTSVHQLQERIVLLTFTDLGVDLQNVSLHNITQLCSRGVGDNSNVICQPELQFQEQSMLIADLGQDGDHELVSFFSTYESGGPDETSSPWRFRSEVHVTPLEAELLNVPAE